MTLVVGRIVDGGVRIVSDTLLTNPRDQRNGYLAAALKPVILHRGLCVAFAGPAEDALRAIVDLGVRPDTGFDLSDVEQSLVRAHRRSRQRVDFLIASLVPVPALVRVTGGTVASSAATWVGDAAAFEAFQANYSNARDAPYDGGTRLERTGSRMREALEVTIDDERLETVGGFCICVASDPNGFTYMAETKAVQGNVPDLVVPAGTTVDIPMGGTAEGAFRYTVDPPVDPGVGCIGIYLQPGNLGLLLNPLESLYAIVVRDVTQEQFEARARDQHGLELRRFGTLNQI